VKDASAVLDELVVTVCGERITELIWAGAEKKIGDLLIAQGFDLDDNTPRL